MRPLPPARAHGPRAARAPLPPASQRIYQKYLYTKIENVSSFEKYFGIQVHVKKNDLKFIVQGLSGYNYYKNNIIECYEQMEIIKKQFDDMFINLRSQEDVMKLATGAEVTVAG